MRVYDITRINNNSVNIKNDLANLVKSDISVLRIYIEIEDIDLDVLYSVRRINSVIDKSTRRLNIDDN